MKKNLSISIVLILTGLSSFAQWEWQNPLPQGNGLKSIYFIDENTGYAAGAFGTILKTINGGANWTTLESGTNNVLTSAFFITPGTGYIAANQNILKTIDSGNTWTSLWDSIPGSLLKSIYFTDINTGYGVVHWTLVQGGSGFYIIKTTDGGNIWKKIWDGFGSYLGPFLPQSLNFIYFADANTGFAAGNGGAILKTVDAGTTWDTLSVQTINSFSSAFFTDVRTGYLVGNNGTILKTSNGGYGLGIIENKQTISLKNVLKIYPNPSSEKITIEYSEPGSNMYGTISIYGMTGQELIRQTVQGSNVELNVKALPIGLYFIRLTNSDNTEFGKFIKD